jgi:hypothetical protein
MASVVGGGGGTSVADLRRALDAGESVESGGYEIAPALARGVSGADLGDIASSALGRTVCIDVTTSVPATVTPATAALVSRLSNLGVDVRASAVTGEPFWMSVEIVRNDWLVAGTVDAFDRANG